MVIGEDADALEEHFNSIKVQLESISQVFGSAKNKFQFHKGSIRIFSFRIIIRFFFISIP